MAPKPGIETILVTGGCGFIGSHSAKELLNRGYHVVVVDEMNDYYDIRIKVSPPTSAKCFHYLKFTFVMWSPSPMC